MAALAGFAGGFADPALVAGADLAFLFMIVPVAVFGFAFTTPLVALAGVDLAALTGAGFFTVPDDGRALLFAGAFAGAFLAPGFTADDFFGGDFFAAATFKGALTAFELFVTFLAFTVLAATLAGAGRDFLAAGLAADLVDVRGRDRAAAFPEAFDPLGDALVTALIFAVFFIAISDSLLCFFALDILHLWAGLRRLRMVIYPDFRKRATLTDSARQCHPKHRKIAPKNSPLFTLRTRCRPP